MAGDDAGNDLTDRLIDAMDGIEGIGFVAFSEKDVVRHPLVQKIITAYERRREGQDGSPRAGAEEGGAALPGRGGGA